MTYVAHVVQYNPVSMTIDVILGQRAGDGTRRYITGISSGAVTVETVADVVLGPALSIPDEAARAPLDALAQHYGGTGDTRALRRDYDHERGRVDKLTDALIAVAAGGRHA